ncbi:MAG: hypothetical protein A2289_19620 [Deltaproteobacteria bacterium RIFOXYA12_FULL_58_15]|nr:MAG: hypothetical protein A2289_19620 [Deltaproteobacteria bacterium RIFOXYA12_FULL_58_15]
MAAVKGEQSILNHSKEETTMWFTIFLIVLFFFALGGGGWGHSRQAYWGWSPAVIILIVGAVLYFTGNLHLNG